MEDYKKIYAVENKSTIGTRFQSLLNLIVAIATLIVLLHVFYLVVGTDSVRKNIRVITYFSAVFPVILAIHYIFFGQLTIWYGMDRNKTPSELVQRFLKVVVVTITLITILNVFWALTEENTSDNIKWALGGILMYSVVFGIYYLFYGKLTLWYRANMDDDKS